MEFNREKFNALVHYVCFRCEDARKLGATKLNKVLWYSDMFAYLAFGSPITGEKYVKQQFGPVPVHISAALRDLRTSMSVVVREVPYFGYAKREFVALNRPDLSLFSANEIGIVDEVLDVVCNDHTASSISETTHDRIWKLAEIGEEIPYYTAFASELGEIDSGDVAWANDLLGLSKAA